MFEIRETLGVGDVGVLGSNNSQHGNVGKDLMILMRWMIFLIYEGRDLTSGWR